MGPRPGGQGWVRGDPPPPPPISTQITPVNVCAKRKIFKPSSLFSIRTYQGGPQRGLPRHRSSNPAQCQCPAANARKPGLFFVLGGGGGVPALEVRGDPPPPPPIPTQITPGITRENSAELRRTRGISQGISQGKIPIPSIVHFLPNSEHSAFPSQFRA